MSEDGSDITEHVQVSHSYTGKRIYFTSLGGSNISGLLGEYVIRKSWWRRHVIRGILEKINQGSPYRP